MRTLVQPLPSPHCELCDGVLLFKGVEPEVPALDIEAQIFICAKCGREHSRKLIRERYAAHTARIGERKG